MAIFIHCQLLVQAEYREIQFGEYPQTHVEHGTELCDELYDRLRKNNDDSDIIEYNGNRYLDTDKGFYKYEPITWFVISGDENRATVISKYVLDNHSYGKIDDMCVSWDQADLRRWCNSEFKDRAFTKEEQFILQTINAISCDWNEEGAMVTQEKVTIPSHEMTEGFSEALRQGWGTDYSGKEEHNYYTRCTGNYWGVWNYPIWITADMGSNSSYPANWSRGIRPCIVLNLSKAEEVERKKEESKIKNLQKANISLSQTSYKFNGNKQTPSVKVTYDGKKLTSGSDYTVTYKNNRYVGTAEVQIKGTGSYTGSVTKKFKIVSPGSVTIKFDKNTKSRTAKVSKSSIKVSRGMQYGKLPTATLKGYKFAGWYTAKKNGKKIESKSYVENNPAKTLYAGWKRVTYKIQYNCDGGKNAKVNPTSYTIASKKITLQEPSRTGYSFSGWYNAKGKKVSTIPAGSTGDITLKAKWTPIKYIIRFNGNSSTNGRMSDISVKYGEKRTLPDNKYRKNGYTFLYWKAKVDGKTKKLNNREKVSNLASENNAVITLTAVWQKNTNTARKDGKTVTIVNPSDSKEGFRYSAFYTDKYFQKTNSLTTAKGGLAKLSAVAALSTYGSNGVNAKELLDDCGFYDILSKNTGTSSRKNNHNARVYLGHSKKMSDGSVVVAVLLNGYTSGRYEWISNFELGTGKYHEGFNIASDKVVTIVKKYIQSEHLQNVKLWITGHSRGAALTNMVAIKMIDAGSIRADQIYAYGFATPQYTTRSGSGYSTIINYVSPHDFVPYVAPAEWGYKRFGHNIVFDDTISGTAIAKYNSYSGRKVYFGKSSYRKKLVKAFVKLGKNPLEYGVVRSWPLGDTVSGYGKVMFSAKEVAQNGIALFMTKDKDEGLDNCLKYSANSSEVLTLMTLLGSGEALMNYITDTHSMLMYLAWIDTLYPTSGQSRPFL